jgi:hypothetical protein
MSALAGTPFILIVPVETPPDGFFTSMLPTA